MAPAAWFGDQLVRAQHESAARHERVGVLFDDPGREASVDHVVAVDRRPFQVHRAVRPVAQDQARRPRFGTPRHRAPAPHAHITSRRRRPRRNARAVRGDGRSCGVKSTRRGRCRAGYPGAGRSGSRVRRQKDGVTSNVDTAVYPSACSATMIQPRRWLAHARPVSLQVACSCEGSRTYAVRSVHTTAWPRRRSSSTRSISVSGCAARITDYGGSMRRAESPCSRRGS